MHALLMHKRFFMICWLKIIFIGILSLFIFPNTSEQTVTGLKADAYTGEKLSANNIENALFTESSSNNYIVRTIEHILKSRYADISGAACITATGCKDSNDYKSIFPTTENTLRNFALWKSHSPDRKNCPDKHNSINSSKDYYVLTLKRIII